MNERMGSLQSHDQRINRSMAKSIEQAFQARGNIFKDKSGSSHEESQNTFGRGRGVLIEEFISYDENRGKQRRTFRAAYCTQKDP